MGRRGKKKPKVIKVRLIERVGDDGKVRQPYQIMEELIGEYHPHLASAKIAMAWKFDMKADADGHVTLGMARKASDLDKELHSYDFVIILNSDMWNRQGFEEKHMRALVDHELCHCEVAKDKDGEEKTDASGKYVWRIRKHDIEEFREIVARHGCWKADLEAFAQTVLNAKQGDTLPFKEPEPSPAAMAAAENMPMTAEVLGQGPGADALRKVLAEYSPKKTAQLIEKAIRTAVEAHDVSVSLIQRHLGIGFSRATHVVEAMLASKLLERVEGEKGAKKYRCTLTADQWEQMKRSEQAA
jgi:hypothetical protein